MRELPARKVSSPKKQPETEIQQRYEHQQNFGQAQPQQGVQNGQPRPSVPIPKPNFRGLSQELRLSSPQDLVLQPKLIVGASKDKYEQEADRVAAEVVQRLNALSAPSVERSQPALPISGKTLLQGGKAQSTPVQQEARGSGQIQQSQPQTIEDGDRSTELESAINEARGRGQALDQGLQRQMSQMMGADFSGVTVHTDSAADRLSRSIQAQAFTTGKDLFFRSGAYNPSSQEGQELIAHELTHVSQQNSSVINRKVSQATGTHSDLIPQCSEISQDAPANVVQRRVGYEFEAQWNVRDVTNMEQAQTELTAAQTARDKTIHITIAKRLAERPQEAEYSFGVALNDQENSTDANGRRNLWFTDNTYSELSAAGLDLISRVDHTKAKDASSSYGAMIQSMYVNKTLSEPPLLGKNITKATAFINATKFDLTADSSPSGGSNLEWVTQPLESKAEVESVMDNIVRMVKYLNSRRRQQFIQVENVTAGGGHPDPNRKMRIYPDGGQLLFAPQMTAGLHIGKISDLINYLEEHQGDNDKAKRRRTKAKADLFGKGDLNFLTEANTGAKRAVEALNVGIDASKNELIGLVTILGNYLKKAENMMARENSKAIAGVMMARTDFFHNFRLIPTAYQKYFRENPDAFVSLVLDAANYQGTENSPIFPRSIEKGTVGNVQAVDITLTRKEWLENIPCGHDILKNYINLSDALKPDPNDPTQNNLIKQKQGDFEALHKSLGALGSVDDTVGPSDAQIRALVVEFRRMKDNLTVDQLKPLALSTYELVDRLNTGNKELKYKPK